MGIDNYGRTEAGVEFYSPFIIAKYVKAFFGGKIDLDPTSSGQDELDTVGAENYFDLFDDCLSLKWFGRVYMNPPYGRNLTDQFTRKLVFEFVSGHIVEGITLIPARTGSPWYSELSESYPVCEYRGRVKFLTPLDLAQGKTEASKGGQFDSGIVYVGPPERFILFALIFQYFGPVKMPMSFIDNIMRDQDKYKLLYNTAHADYEAIKLKEGLLDAR